MPNVEFEITGERLRTLNEDSVRFYLALDRSPEQIALAYDVSVSKVEKVITAVRRREGQEQARRDVLETVTRRTMRDRPMPPPELVDPLTGVDLFAPSPEMAEWVRATFLDGGPLRNSDHAHLAAAEIGFLWTNVQNKRNMRRVVGQAELPKGQGGKWAKGRAEFQLRQWFGGLPDFLITLDAVHWVQAEDAPACGLTDHELYHCAQAVDSFGEPRFDLDDQPVWAIKGHDVEEFIGVIERYGVGAASGGVSALVKAAGYRPSVSAADVAAACGTCLR